MDFQFIQHIDAIPSSDWDQWHQDQDPFCQRAFLSALETSGSVSADTGWTPTHLVAYQGGKAMGLLPLYQKTHSYGEYVFDFAWADAYHRHQLSYYPKWVNAIPFTPVTGTRLFHHPDICPQTLLLQISSFLQQQLPEHGISSLHLLFHQPANSQALQQQQLLQRRSVQFQWFNRDFADFNHYLQSFTARRRKMVRKERAKIAAQEIQVRRFDGQQISQTEMDFFYQCYCQTYLKRSGHTGYLSRDFFTTVLRTMPDNLMLVVAYQHQQPVAGALYFYNQQQLCGRYWGALAEFDGLHFECCYYQGIEFSIAKGLTSFNPGTQGEHKILRGFEPIYCYSNHYLARAEFHQAVARFIAQETPSIVAYKNSAEQLLPFKQPEQ